MIERRGKPNDGDKVHLKQMPPTSGNKAGCFEPQPACGYGSHHAFFSLDPKDVTCEKCKTCIETGKRLPMGSDKTLLAVMRKANKSFTNRGIALREINNGYCDDWAQTVMDELNDVEVWETVFGFSKTSHVFLRINGKFYDAECHQGVMDHMDLPIFNKIFAEFAERQPVWCIDHNYDEVPPNMESKRDLSDADERQYQIDNGMPVTV